MKKGNSFELDCVVDTISDIITTSTGTFRYREVVAGVMGGRYVDYIKFQAVDEGVMRSLDKYKSQDLVKIHFKISGRKVNKGGEVALYNNNQIININKLIQ
jgi:hypothetical protein